ncbi:hypothetical protein DFH06DRAFT_1339813 [Mycena polygramma]|nr:hypothetical protein DFH06DRAFT_1339813 [Mycena polygramma]
MESPPVCPLPRSRRAAPIFALSALLLQHHRPPPHSSPEYMRMPVSCKTAPSRQRPAHATHSDRNGANQARRAAAGAIFYSAVPSPSSSLLSPRMERLPRTLTLLCSFYVALVPSFHLNARPRSLKVHTLTSQPACTVHHHVQAAGAPADMLQTQRTRAHPNDKSPRSTDGNTAHATRFPARHSLPRLQGNTRRTRRVRLAAAEFRAPLRCTHGTVRLARTRNKRAPPARLYPSPRIQVIGAGKRSADRECGAALPASASPPSPALSDSSSEPKHPPSGTRAAVAASLPSKKNESGGALGKIMRYVPYRISVFSSTSLVGRHRCDDARAQGNAVLVWNPPRRHPASAFGATAACADDTWLDSRCARGLKMARATRVHRQCGVTLVQVYNGCNSTAGCLGSDRDLTDVDHTIWVNRLCVEHRCDSADNVNSGRINYIGFHAFQPSRGGNILFQSALSDTVLLFLLNDHCFDFADDIQRHGCKYAGLGFIIRAEIPASTSLLPSLPAGTTSLPQTVLSESGTASQQLIPKNSHLRVPRSMSGIGVASTVPPGASSALNPHRRDSGCSNTCYCCSSASSSSGDTENPLQELKSLPTHVRLPLLLHDLDCEDAENTPAPREFRVLWICDPGVWHGEPVCCVELLGVPGFAVPSILVRPFRLVDCQGSETTVNGRRMRAFTFLAVPVEPPSHLTSYYS